MCVEEASTQAADWTLGGRRGTLAGNGEAGTPGRAPLVPCAPGPSRLSLLGGTSRAPTFLRMRGARRANPEAGCRAPRVRRGESQPGKTTRPCWRTRGSGRQVHGQTQRTVHLGGQLHADATCTSPPPSGWGRPGRRPRPAKALGTAAQKPAWADLWPVLSSAPPPTPRRKPAEPE